MLIITSDLASRLESAEAIDAAGCAEAQCRLQINCRAAVRAIAGGIAVFCGETSPLTRALGLGMHGPVSSSDLEELEHFFRERDTPVVVDLCPHADPGLPEALAARGYRLVEFTNMLVRPISSEVADIPVSPDLLVRPAEPQEIETYISTVIGGFFSREELSEEEISLGQTLFQMPCASAYLAFVGGQAVGGAMVSTRNKVANLFGDATHPSFRGRGVHAALIGARIGAAEKAGCDLVAAITAPGSSSQRNYQRLGFQIAYTKATMLLE